MLLTFLNTRRGAVLLLDEPDAHLHTALAKVVYRWLAEDEAPVGIPPARLDALRNFNGDIRTIRVDSKVVRESDGGESKSDADRWMRLTLDTVGKTDWPRDRQGRPLYPEGFEALARKLERPLHPPGRDVRCIVSVGMLTEGWDCNTVTHIIGLRPFMSQLLCEQVVGRGLRRTSYAVGTDDRLSEEVAKIFGVPFEIIPLKENPQGSGPAPTPKTWRIRAVPEKAHLEIRFPRIEGYTQAIRHRVTVDWDSDDRSIVASSGLTAAVVAAAEVRTPSVARDPPNTARRGRTVVRSGGPISE